MNEITVQIVYESASPEVAPLFFRVKSEKLTEDEMRDNIPKVWDDFVAKCPDTDYDFIGYLNASGYIASNIDIEDPLVLRG